jgi:hypothetical protein
MFSYLASFLLAKLMSDSVSLNVNRITLSPTSAQLQYGRRLSSGHFENTQLTSLVWRYKLPTWVLKLSEVIMHLLMALTFI